MSLYNNMRALQAFGASFFLWAMPEINDDDDDDMLLQVIQTDLLMNSLRYLSSTYYSL